MSFIHTLKSAIKSEVLHDSISRQLYSTDASMYRIEPAAVVLPRTTMDLISAIEIASRYDVPIIARGAATGVIGGCLGKGLIIDCSKHLSRIIEINPKERFAIVQPGVVLDQLNQAVAPHGLCFGPDTSTSNRATIGGMVSTNASGSHSLIYGTTQDHIIEIELILWNGEVIRFRPLNKQEWQEKCALETSEGKIYRTLESIKKEYKEDIANHFPLIHRKSSGYLLDGIINENFNNISKLICGSEGSLGVISEIKLALSPLITNQTMIVVGTKQFLETLKATSQWLSFSPTSLELIDKKIIEAGKNSPLMRNRLSFLEKEPEALVIIECDSANAEKLLQAFLKNSNTLFAKVIEDPIIQKNVWDLRKTGLGLLLSQKSYSRAIAFMEDIALPIDALFPCITEITELLFAQKKTAGIYGHLGAGCLHIRPYFDTRSPEELEIVKELMNQVMNLVTKYKGVLSSEHGDGLSRSWTTKKLFSPRINEAFSELKLAFDPHGRMNPGKIVGDTQELFDNLKFSPDTITKKLSPYLDFSREGGFSLAVDMCNGNGACRKKEGVMCPSYQVTHDEKDSTRARANALQGIIHGHIDEKEMTSQEFQSVMDLCIQCKGCKTECPSQIDMAKLKSEYLYQLHKKKNPSLRDRLFAFLPSLFRLGSLTPSLVNQLNSTPYFRKVLSLIGITEERTLPHLAKKRFSTLFSTQKKREGAEVVLFIDTFTEFLAPAIGIAAVEVLEALQFSVITPKWHCCGRTLISKGFLPEAKKKLQAVIDILYPYAKKGLKIVGLEPSCILTLYDEIRDFGLDQEKVETVRQSCMTIDQFLFGHIDELTVVTTPYSGTIKLHGHCHQKSLVGMAKEKALLQKLCSKQVIEIPSGCCGMAGSFGYEKEHASFSKEIGNLTLFPSIIASDRETLIIASGTSCRAQIEDALHKKPLHLVEFIQAQLIK